MKKAIAIIEFTTVSAGIRSADMMAKMADIEIIESQAVCPGKYMIIVAGLLSAVAASVEAAKVNCGERYISSFILGNPHESLMPAFYGTTRVEKIQALGVLETFDAASAVMAADTAVKTAIVDLIEVRLAKGMCGKSFVTLTGEIAAVEAAIAKATTIAAESGMFLDSCVIANPDKKLERFLL
ncbi:MAG: BMC domain-containing protein [Defluviitaleaceae bacterium]|nr:BMC domain-containing protein [Defluviitaleaceae bacterium]